MMKISTIIKGCRLATHNIDRDAVRSISKVVATNIMLCLLVVIVSELIFGTWISGSSKNMMLAKKEFSYIFDSTPLYEEGGPISYKRDINGFRGRYSDPGNIGILTIGGSTTDQRYIGDTKTFQDILAARFHDAGHPLSVVNAGRDGQSTVGHLRAFEEWFPYIPDLRAKYIMAYIGINDRRLHDVDRSSYDNFKEMTTKHRTLRYIENHSALYMLYRTIRGSAAARKGGLDHGQARIHSTDPVTGESLWRLISPPPDLTALEKAQEQNLKGYEERVTRLIARIRATGAEAIIVTQSEADYRVRDGAVYGRLRPDGTIDPGGYAELTAFNRRALKACQDAAAICLDLGAELWFDDRDFYDICHTTPSGARKIGNYLFEKLYRRIDVDGGTSGSESRPISQAKPL